MGITNNSFNFGTYSLFLRSALFFVVLLLSGATIGFLNVVCWDKVKWWTGLARFWIRIHWCAFRYRKALKKISCDHGVLGTESFRKWLNEHLASKLGKSKHCDVLFSDLRGIDLKIIAANGRTRAIEVFTKKTHPGLPIADAVCASISIPFVFKPKHIDDATYVDGGIMSNFPAWVFDEEREQAPWRTPTIGFRLVESTPYLETENSSRRPLIAEHIKDVLVSSVFGDNGLETRNVSTLRELMLAIKLGVLDFDASDEKKDAAHDAAYRIASGKLVNETFRVSDENMGQMLNIVERVIREEANNFKGHLRLSISLPVDENSLRIVYSHNMDGPNDTDDRLVFNAHQGATGRCWSQGRAVTCDLVDAEANYASEWNMDKYQQKLVRKDLLALLCYPIYYKSGTQDERLLGVLSIDSADDILIELEALADSDPSVLKDCADILGKQLVEWKLT